MKHTLDITFVKKNSENSNVNIASLLDRGIFKDFFKSFVQKNVYFIHNIDINNISHGKIFVHYDSYENDIFAIFEDIRKSIDEFLADIIVISKETDLENIAVYFHNVINNKTEYDLEFLINKCIDYIILTTKENENICVLPVLSNFKHDIIRIDTYNEFTYSNSYSPMILKKEYNIIFNIGCGSNGFVSNKEILDSMVNYMINDESDYDSYFVNIDYNIKNSGEDKFVIGLDEDYLDVFKYISKYMYNNSFDDGKIFIEYGLIAERTLEHITLEEIKRLSSYLRKLPFTVYHIVVPNYYHVIKELNKLENLFDTKNNLHILNAEVFGFLDWGSEPDHRFAWTKKLLKSFIKETFINVKDEKKVNIRKYTMDGKDFYICANNYFWRK